MGSSPETAKQRGSFLHISFPYFIHFWLPNHPLWDWNVPQGAGLQGFSCLPPPLAWGFCTTSTAVTRPDRTMEPLMFFFSRPVCSFALLFILTENNVLNMYLSSHLYTQMWYVRCFHPNSRCKTGRAPSDPPLALPPAGPGPRSTVHVPAPPCIHSRPPSSCRSPQFSLTSHCADCTSTAVWVTELPHFQLFGDTNPKVLRHEGHCHPSCAFPDS